MKTTYYVPIYNWGDHPETVNGVTSGCTMYDSLQGLFGFEGNDVVGYFEVEGYIPTQKEFQESVGISPCGAV